MASVLFQNERLYVVLITILRRMEDRSPTVLHRALFSPRRSIEDRVADARIETVVVAVCSAVPPPRVVQPTEAAKRAYCITLSERF